LALVAACGIAGAVAGATAEGGGRAGRRADLPESWRDHAAVLQRRLQASAGATNRYVVVFQEGSEGLDAGKGRDALACRSCVLVPS
jgi:hypothetical protein